MKRITAASVSIDQIKTKTLRVTAVAYDLFCNLVIGRNPRKASTVNCEGVGADISRGMITESCYLAGPNIKDIQTSLGPGGSLYRARHVEKSRVCHTNARNLGLVTCLVRRTRAVVERVFRGLVGDLDGARAVY